jgi:uncharacterized protein (TIGR02588 family)
MGRASDSEGDRDRDSDEHDLADPIPPLEWAIAALGLVLVVVCVGFLVHRGWTHQARPPDIAVTAVSTERSSAGYLLRFRAVNRGDAAAEVEIRAELGAGDEREVGEATIDLMPAGAVREGGMFFRSDPRRGRLELRAVSYQDP